MESPASVNDAVRLAMALENCGPERFKNLAGAQRVSGTFGLHAADGDNRFSVVERIAYRIREGRVALLERFRKTNEQ